ncbi:MAG: hypothetical protein AB1405_09370, partial [Bdellovibrionota bacterium]
GTPVSAEVLPAIVKGAQVPSLIGSKNKEVFAYACPKGALVPIPVQIDDVNAEGRILPDSGPGGLVADESPGVMDATDEIVVRVKDLAPACPPAALAQLNGKVSEAAIGASYFKEKLFVYLMVGGKGASAPTDLRYDPAQDTIHAPGYSWGYSLKQPCLYTVMNFLDLKGREKDDLSDRLRVRMKARALGSLIRLKIDEDEVICTLHGVRTGPLRVTRELMAVVSPLPGFTVNAAVSFIHYERFLQAWIRVKMPAPAALFVSSLDVAFAHDFTDLKGLRFSTSALPGGAVVDGRMIESERRIDIGPEPWYYLSGQGVNQITTLDMEAGLKLRAVNQFIDDPAYLEPPEEIPGCLPCLGYELLGWENMQARWYTFGAAFAFLKGFPEGGGSGYYKTLRTPFEIHSAVRGEPAAQAGQGGPDAAARDEIERLRRRIQELERQQKPAAQ